MNRMIVLYICTIMACLLNVVSVAEILPTGSAPAAIEFEHFPDRLHAFVWRNWELVSAERMARVLDTTPDNIRRMGQSMGLPLAMVYPDTYEQRAYISIIRRNWHLLPYNQLLTLLDWDAQKLAFTLREDDFLWIKLGSLKPSCQTLQYMPPDQSTMKRCGQIRATVLSHFKEPFDQPARPRFDFLEDVSPIDIQHMPKRNPDTEQPIRFLYSYFGVFGDPLLNPELDPYPDTLLQSLSERGVNGIWLHVVLRQLAPSTLFPEFGVDSAVRTANLRRLVNRAGKYGIKVYLYINEPRAMPELFFKDREELKGFREGDHFSLCTSNESVRQWLKESLRYVFSHVPDLGGVFTITASENLTNCYSHNRHATGCPRCSKRSGPEVIAEVNRTIAAGVWEGNPDAVVIVWDWGWPDGTAAGWGRPDWAEKIIEALPDNIYLMSVSEWGKPIIRGGISSAVGEYSISSVGPGPRAQRHWALAKKRGLKTIAKVQVNSSWELSAVPFIPSMHLIAQHCSNLSNAGIDGLMLSWTVGGYPSPNLDLVQQFQSAPIPTVKEALTNVAKSRYGQEATEVVLDAWSQFSSAFTEYPFHIGFVYSGPAQYGPANLLYTKPTGYRATMIGFPYDDLEGWQGIYPADVLARQFETMAQEWRQGLFSFEKVLPRITDQELRTHAWEDFGVAEAVYLHCKSVANLVRFTLARNALLSDSLNQAKRENRLTEIKTIVTDEIQNAKRLFTLTRNDPRIGFEASNQYYYVPLDLVEKVLNCEYVLNSWLPYQTIMADGVGK
ncbi:MAG: hypothetical protein JXA82_13475 [Sedimentisphaerales bacterium]|nr:hypothetical protein [Sedimentisphaerales bacterium]